MGLAHGLALLSIKDAAGAEAWFDAAFKDAGATTTSETYDGVTLTVLGGSDGPKGAFAIIERSSRDPLVPSGLLGPVEILESDGSQVAAAERRQGN